MAFIVWFYVVTGGLKASTWVGVIQFILLVVSIVVLGFYSIKAPALGGWGAFSSEIAKLDVKYLEVPKLINFGLGGGWTAVMILTYMFAYYYNNEAVRWLTVLSAVLYSMFYSGL